MELNRLNEFAKKNNIELNESQFSLFGEMLLEKNKVMNLTAITDEKEVELKHFIDSLAAAPYLKEKGAFSLIDIGTGAGFPGIPLKIVFPQCEFVLLDSLNKRIEFLKEVIAKLNLKNIEAIAGRAEELGRTEFRENFDFCVSRAVANMSVLLEYCLPFVKVGGTCILYKSGEFEAELKEAKAAIEVLGGELSDIKTFELSEGEIKRSLIFINKIKATPDKYPRRPGKPSKSPIK